MYLLIVGVSAFFATKPRNYRNTTLDTTFYRYDDISNKDIWLHNVTYSQGCRDLTKELYLSQIIDSDDTWIVSIYLPGDPTKEEPDRQNFYSSEIMKSLYFLKRDLPSLNCALLNWHDEEMREVFESAGLPQTLLIVNRKVYYMQWEAITVQYLHEFLIRYEEL
jgi:hypothetical protein